MSPPDIPESKPLREPNLAASGGGDLEVKIPVTRILYFLLLVEIVFFGVDCLIYFNDIIDSRHIRRLLDITKETNLPTWFSSIQFVVVGLVAAAAALYRSHEGRGRLALGWLLVALFFVFSGIDDTAMIHERLGSFAEDLAKDAREKSLFVQAIDAWPSYYWQIVVLPFFIGFGLFMTVFFWRELKGRDVWVLFAAGLFCYAGAVALDVLEGTKDYKVLMKALSMKSKEVRHLMRSVEEVTEMVGTTLILTAFLENWRRLAGKGGVTFRVVG
ncbi:MAG: hypothetical protein HQL52_01865 [Magnetococcales bacterium]|nr:hypothetical protein [Magnetococcales bacterium]